jgi:hypothetical protein
MFAFRVMQPEATVFDANRRNQRSDICFGAIPFCSVCPVVTCSRTPSGRQRCRTRSVSPPVLRLCTVGAGFDTMILNQGKSLLRRGLISDVV